MKSWSLLLILIAPSAHTQDFDLLIRGGRIVDGTGNPAFMGDMGIRKDKIAAMGRLAGRTAARIMTRKA